MIDNGDQFNLFVEGRVFDPIRIMRCSVLFIMVLSICISAWMWLGDPVTVKGGSTIETIVKASEVILKKSDVSDKVCETLKARYVEQGFITVVQRLSYCEEECFFANIPCVTETAKAGANINIDMSGVMSSVRSFFESDEQVKWDFTVDEGVKLAWFEMAMQFSPIFMSIIPILLNQYKYFGFMQAILCFILYIGCMVLADYPFMITAHNIAVAVLCLVHPAGSIALLETVQIFLPMCSLVFLIFIPNPVFQMCVLTLTVVGFGFYLRWMFFSKHKSHMSAFVGFLQVFVVWEQLSYVRMKFAEQSLVGAGIEMVIRTMMPGGNTRIGLFNMINFGKHVAFKLPLLRDYQLYGFMFITFAQLIMFLVFRASFGQYCMMTLRFKSGADQLWEGMMVYMCDVFGPIRCIYRIVFGIENINRRRVCYAGVSLCILFHEYSSALEFFALRVVFSLCDLFLFDSGKASATKYLGESFDVMQRSFPQKGSFPWLSLDDVVRLNTFVGEVVAFGNSAVRGVGVALKVANKVKLYTVKHVVDGVNMITFKGNEIHNPVSFPLTNGDDPIVVVDMPESHLNPPECPVLLREEAKFVEHLLFINVCETDSFITFVPPGNFSLRRDELSAHVNLKPGDSGGPCFAVLRDGGLRYCGAVSRGRTNRAAGNIISFVYGDDDLGVDSSDGEDTLVDTGMFNRARRVTFASEVEDEGRKKDYKELVSFLKREKASLQSSYNHFSGLRIDPDSRLESLAIHTKYLENRPPKREESDEDADDDPEKSIKNKRDNRKFRNKDRAAWKRRLDTTDVLWTRLRKVYDRKGSKKIFDAIVHDNNFFDLSIPKFVKAPDRLGGWLYVDSFVKIE